MRSIIRNNGINLLMILHMYQKEIDKVDVRNTASKVITKNNPKKRQFHFLRVL